MIIHGLKQYLEIHKVAEQKFPQNNNDPQTTKRRGKASNRELDKKRSLRRSLDMEQQTRKLAKRRYDLRSLTKRQNMRTQSADPFTAVLHLDLQQKKKNKRKNEEIQYLNNDQLHWVYSIFAIGFVFVNFLQSPFRFHEK